MNSIAIFVDVQNIYYTTRQAFGRFFDYSKLWSIVQNQGKISIARAYAIKRDREDQIKFQNRLRAIGFDVKLKPYIHRQDGSSKGDLDVGITIDILECASSVNKIILFKIGSCKVRAIIWSSILISANYRKIKSASNRKYP